MSKMMNELNNLNESRNIQGGIAIEDEQNNQEPVRVIREHKGIYFLSFLTVVLIAFSIFSLSTSLKTFAQLEASLANSKIILSSLNQHSADIKALESIITKNTSKELVQIDELKSQMSGQMNELALAIKGREKKLDDMLVAYNNLKTSTEDSISELKMSDKLMLEKYISLNTKVEKLRDANSLYLNTY